MTISEQPPVLDDLSELEQRVVEAARSGALALPSARIRMEDLAVTDDPRFLLRAEIVRELMIGRRGELDPRGVRFGAVRIVGRLDLDHATAIVGLSAIACALPDGITCYNARLRRTSLKESLIAGLYADSLRVDGGLTLHGAVVLGTDSLGAIQLRGSHITGDLNLDRITVSSDEGPALLAERSQIGHSMFMREATVIGHGRLGAIRIFGTHIGGDLELDGIETRNTDGPAISADELRVDHRLLLSSARLSGNGSQGAVRFVGAKIGAQLILGGSQVKNSTGPALMADHLQVDGGLFLNSAVIEGAAEPGAVVLTASKIRNHFAANRAVISNDSGPAINADGFSVDNGILIQDAAVTGVSGKGAIRLSGAHVTGTLDLDRSKFCNSAGPVLSAEGIRIDKNLFLRDSELDGAGDSGTVRLLNAFVGGQVNLKKTKINNNTGPALIMAATTIEGTFFVSEFLLCAQANLKTKSKCSNADYLQVEIQGLKYAQLMDATWLQWLHILLHHTSSYRPQPYQQLAAAERAAGHETNARKVLIVQQEDLRARRPDALGGRVARWRHGLWGQLGRYGYRADRIVGALAIVISVAGGLGYAAGQVTTRDGHHAAERVTPVNLQNNGPGIPCSTAELIGLGIDRGLPLGATGLRARCDLDTSTRRGQAFTYVAWLLQALVWALATLAVAAYTGLVRKPA